MRKHLPKAIDLAGKALEVTTAIVEHPAKNVVQQVVCNGTAEVVKIALTGAIMTPVVVPATALQQPLNNVTEPAAQVIRNGCNTLFEAGREISNTNSKAVKGALEKITEAAKHINLTH